MKRCLLNAAVVILMILVQSALADMAVIDGGTADKVHLRQGRSRDQASLGLYFTGTKTVARNIPFAGDSWWCFSSGAGAWRTTLHLLADGTFSGLFEDSDMGDTGTAYPNGTQYISRFSGRFSAATQVAEGVYYARVEALSWEGTADEVAYVDGVRVITREPYGLSQGDDMLMCMQGVDASRLTESQRIWVQDNISEGKVIRPVLINQSEDWGFFWTE